MARCSCRIFPDRIAIFNRAEIPARHAHSTFENFRETPGNAEAKKRAYAWTFRYGGANQTKGLVLHGPVGRGKTHLMIAALRLLVFQRGVRVRFVEFSHLLAELKRGFETGGNAARMSAFDQVEVLAIDELGKGRATDWELTILDELISRAYNDNRLVLGTSNYAPGEPTGRGEENLSEPGSQANLIDRVGYRVDSRLKQMVDYVRIMGPDMRAN